MTSFTGPHGICKVEGLHAHSTPIEIDWPALLAKVEQRKADAPHLLTDDEVKVVVMQWLTSAGQRGSDSLPSLVETIAKLRGWMRLNGRHTQACAAWSGGSWREDDHGICNCGLAELLR